MSSSTNKSAYGKGLRDGLPFILVAIPFSMLFGVVATEAGFSIQQTMTMTTLVIAGAAQFTAVQLMLESASFWLIIAGALAVNLRMAMYSASLVAHMGGAPLWMRALAAYFMFDQNYAAAVNEFEDNPERSPTAKALYFLGVASVIAPIWISMTYMGAVVGSAIPPEYALDFALPITFLAMVGPALRSIAHIAAAIVSIVAALALAGLPAGMGLLVAAALAMGTGAGVEIWMEGRK